MAKKRNIDNKYWFSVNGKLFQLVASTRDIAFSKLKKQYPTAEIADAVVNRQDNAK